MTGCIDPITHCVECGAKLSVFTNVRCPSCYHKFMQLSIDEQAEANREAAARLEAQAAATVAEPKGMYMIESAVYPPPSLTDWVQQEGIITPATITARSRVNQAIEVFIKSLYDYLSTFNMGDAEQSVYAHEIQDYISETQEMKKSLNEYPESFHELEEEKVPDFYDGPTKIDLIALIGIDNNEKPTVITICAHHEIRQTLQSIFEAYPTTQTITRHEIALLTSREIARVTRENFEKEEGTNS